MCRKALFDFQLLEGVDKIVVALSGGKDSLTLLFLLKAISGRGFSPFQLYAIHVDGEFSCGAGIQKELLQAICQELGVRFISRSSTQTKEGLECYSCSRERRRLIFEEAKKLGATTVAFGHHRDDSIQTLLMNLLHKAEFAAILPKIPMYDYGITIIRPLIYISEQEIVEFSRLYRFARISCQCPVGQQSMRKKTKELLKQLEDFFPNTHENLAKASLQYGSKKALEVGF